MAPPSPETRQPCGIAWSSGFGGVNRVVPELFSSGQIPALACLKFSGEIECVWLACTKRRRARAVEWACLESKYTFTGIRGSNPLASVLYGPLEREYLCKYYGFSARGGCASGGESRPLRSGCSEIPYIERSEMVWGSCLRSIRTAGGQTFRRLISINIRNIF